MFLFPYAGGGPAAFGKWPAELGKSLDVYIAHYPGRGSRFKEPPIKRIPILVESFIQAFQPLLDKPFAFLGHSFGGLIAFELAREIQPQVLFISSSRAPHIPNPHPPIRDLPDDEFFETLQKFNGIPAEVAEHSELMELLLPMLRADFEAFENYRPNSHQLTCPIIVFGGLNDSHVSWEHLEGWVSHTSAGFKSQYFPGDHFFINTAHESVIATINAELTSHAGG